MSQPAMHCRPGTWITILAALCAGGCQFSDIAAFRNTTQSPVTLYAQVDGEFAQYDCDGSGSDLSRFVDETEVVIQPGQSICLEGPATDFDDQYDVLEMLFLVEIVRGEDLCVELEGEALPEQFVPEGRFKTLVVDNERCPGDVVIEPDEPQQQ